MSSIIELLGPQMFVVALLVGLGAGIIKGMVGFAMPMIMISVLGTLISPELALAGLILPTFVTNGMQALRQGRKAAWESMKRFRVFLLAGLVMLLISAQFVRILPTHIMLLAIGLPVAVFMGMQLAGHPFRVHSVSHRVEAMVGGLAGLIGGISGIWGPPTVAYLTALHTEKKEQMRIQGVIYGLGALALFGAHLSSGVLNAKTLPFSVLMIVPTVIGMWIGGKLHDSIDQKTFRKATQVILFVAALNLIRKALMIMFVG